MKPAPVKIAPLVVVVVTVAARSVAHAAN
jgi:hypothetical protein